MTQEEIKVAQKAADGRERLPLWEIALQLCRIADAAHRCPMCGFGLNQPSTKSATPPEP